MLCVHCIGNVSNAVANPGVDVYHKLTELPWAISMHMSPVDLKTGSSTFYGSCTSARQFTCCCTIAAGPVEEEVFENERFQPFKGWGHNWPGHFLPTDKIGHWSHRDGTPGKAASMAFSTVAPKLPKASPSKFSKCTASSGSALPYS